ncbi:Alpha/Beta hydrolase protein [Aspergillus karnatakaensis]|uniref:alpha/beta fold hydrolase n=1 Tax=Aspergillus karnatakaensis TaxID=1810916 RepID=UPI003CCCA98D
MFTPGDLPPLPLPEGIRSRYLDTEPWGLQYHILESIPPTTQPTELVLFIHGFPELAYSWRYALPKIASAGYHAVAVDQRGHGRTTSSTPSALAAESFRPINLSQDFILLVHALGYTRVKCIVGHDTGSLTAAAERGNPRLKSCTFIVGDRDPAPVQDVNGARPMEDGTSVAEGKYRGTVVIPGAGHWLSQEAPEETADAILNFLKEI